MNPSGVFRFDQARHAAAADLRPEHHADFQRLVKTLCHGGRFQLLFIECTDERYRDRLIRRVDEVLNAAGLRPARIDLDPARHPDFAAVEVDLAGLAKEHKAIHVTGGAAWFDEARWEAFNIRREAVSQLAPLRLLLWLSEATAGRIALLAPDLWAWRGGVFCFEAAPAGVPVEPPTPQHGPIDARTLAQCSKRIAVLRAFLQSEPPPPDELALPLWDELAGLLRSIGRQDDALDILREGQLPACERLGDVRSKAITQGKIADILQARGQVDEALRIRVEDQLPVYERLGDVRAKAVALFKIARIELEREQWAEALAHLAEAYEIAEKLKAPDGLAAVGELYGPLLIQASERDRGLAVLNTAREAAALLGREDDAARLGGLLEQLRQAPAASQPSDPPAPGWLRRLGRWLTGKGGG